MGAALWFFFFFLGKEVPEVAFPSIKDQKHMQEFVGVVARGEV